jgi:hypothetical protein
MVAVRFPGTIAHNAPHLDVHLEDVACMSINPCFGSLATQAALKLHAPEIMRLWLLTPAPRACYIRSPQPAGIIFSVSCYFDQAT